MGNRKAESRREFLRAAGAGLASTGCAARLRGQGTDAAIVPRPRSLQISGAGRTELRPDMPVLLGKSLAAIEHQWVPRPLLRRLREKPAIQPAIVESAGAALAAPSILIGKPGDHRELAALAKELGSKAGRTSAGEGYVLATGPQGVRIAAESPAGAFHAVQSLLQTMGGGTAVPEMKAADAPDVPFRGMHIRARDPRDIPILQRFIREVLPRLKANTVILEINYGFRFRSHPEINEDTMLDEAQAQGLARLCRENGIKLIPMINCFGHQSWHRSIRGLLRAYPQFNETPCKPDSIMYSWCASDPRIAPIVFELIDELITAFEADTIHLGMDEVIEIAQCPFCRRKTPAELFAKVVNEFHEHVTGKRGLRMSIWGDRLIDGRKTPYNPMNGSRNGTHPALGMIPKDILLCDWHYHLHETYPSVQMFSEAGFEFTACGWQKKDAIRAFHSYAKKHGGSKYLGYLATNWSPFNRIARYMVEGEVEESTAAETRNFAECIQLGLELAWTGA